MSGVKGYAVTLTVNGDEMVAETMPIEGPEVEYDTLSQAVGGFIERVPLSVPEVDKMPAFSFDLWVNEEGLLRDLPLNLIATGLAGLLSGSMRPLVGNCIITGTDPTGETTPPLSEAQAKVMAQLVLMVAGRL